MNLRIIRGAILCRRETALNDSATANTVKKKIRFLNVKKC